MYNLLKASSVSEYGRLGAAATSPELVQSLQNLSKTFGLSPQWNAVTCSSRLPSPIAMGCGGSKPIESWKIQDVVAFLNTIELNEHAEAFKKSAISGDVLLTLTEKDMLQTLGIVNELHRRKLLMEIAKLRKATMRIASGPYTC